MILTLAWDVLQLIGDVTSLGVFVWLACWFARRTLRRTRRHPSESDVTALAKALFEVGLTSIGPDDLDNRQIASRLLAGGYVRKATQ